MRFIHADALKNDTVIEQYDLIFSRMMMQHLYFSDVLKLLVKLSKSGSTFILMTTYIKAQNRELQGNIEKDRYRFRPLNLQVR